MMNLKTHVVCFLHEVKFQLVSLCLCHCWIQTLPPGRKCCMCQSFNSCWLGKLFTYQ